MNSKSILTLCAILIAAMLVAAAGCTTAIKEGVGVARGAKGVYAPIQPVAAVAETRPLGIYKRFELGEFVDDFGGKVPAGLMPAFRRAFASQIADNKLPNEPQGKTLLIRGRLLHYESASTLAVAIGPLEQVIARVELVDKDTGQVLGVANCIGRTTTRVNVGVDKKGDGLAKAIVSWLAARYPKPAE